MFIEVVAVQFFPSITNGPYCPAERAPNVEDAPNAIPSMEYVYPPVPPLAFNEILPVDWPKQSTFCGDPDRVKTGGSATVVLEEMKQLFASVVVKE